jgi:GPH family glycoside/pentoside/hexuronide:cation symporter
MSAAAETVQNGPVEHAAPGLLKTRHRVLYSVSSLGGEALGQSRAAWLLYYYAPPDDSGLAPLLPLGLIGVLLAVLKIVGSLDDAIIGYWSDRADTRLGRRLPFILVGTPLAALFAVLIVTPPSNQSTALIAVYLFATMSGYNIFSTVSGGPYEALLPEIARKSSERVGLVGMRVYFGVAGAGIGLVVSGRLVDLIGVRAMMIVMVGIFFACRYAGMFGVWNLTKRDQAPAKIPFKEAMRATLKNPQFMAFLPTFVLFQTGLGMLTGVLPYYAKAVLRTDNEGTWVSILTATSIGAMVLAIPVFSRIARRRSKREAYGLAMLIAGLMFPLLGIAGFLPGVPREAQILLVMLLIGAPLAGIYLFPAALTADIVDFDTTQTGLRREATYYGTQNFVEKTAGALSPLALALLLMLGNTASNPTGIRLVGPVAGLCILGGFWLFRSYTLPDDVLGDDHPSRSG